MNGKGTFERKMFVIIIPAFKKIIVIVTNSVGFFYWSGFAGVVLACCYAVVRVLHTVDVLSGFSMLDPKCFSVCCYVVASVF